MRKLLIVSSSSRIVPEQTGKMLAVDRYDGVFFRVLRKALRDSRRRDIDVLILSPVYGLIKGNEQIEYHKPLMGKWGTLSLSEDEVTRMREKNLSFLESFIRRHEYSETYVNVGREYMKLIEGLEKFLTHRVTYAKGKGVGPKAADMKMWILGEK